MPSYEKNIDLLVRKLEKNLSPQFLDNLCQSTGLIQRQRKYAGHVLFWSVLGGFCLGNAPEIAGMLRAFNQDTGLQIQYNAFYKWLQKPGFAALMRQAYLHLSHHLHTENPFLQKWLLGNFRDIFIQDGSSFALNDLLKSLYPGRFTHNCPAAVELHVFHSLRSAAPQSVTLAPDSVSEYQFMPTAKDADLADTLSLFDRGYGSIPRLHLLEEAGGFFICRMRTNTNPCILSASPSLETHSGKLFQNVPLKKKRDYEFSVRFENHEHIFRHLRLIALWNPASKKHVLLLTNTDQAVLDLTAIGRLYRLRWQIELLFKELKSHTELRKFLTANEHIAEGFIWAALCALIIRRFLLASAQSLSGKKLSFHKAAISARCFIPQFIACALSRFENLRECLEQIFAFLTQNMFFSNPRRPCALQRAGLIL